MDQKIKVYISFPREDKLIAEKVVMILEKHAIQCMWNPDFAIFSNLIKDSFRSSDLFMPLISTKSLERGWVYQEIGYAESLNMHVLPFTTESSNVFSVGIFYMILTLNIDVNNIIIGEFLISHITEILSKPPKRVLEPPFEAYSGQESYLFVSYSHNDSTLVYPEIYRLHQFGFRIWYDEGIDPGNEWPEEVALALDKCSFFLVFITPKSVESQNVKNEINFAINHKKPFLAIHLEETMLPKGLELRMGDIQAILKWRMQEDRYFRQIEKTVPINLLKATK